MTRWIRAWAAIAAAGLLAACGGGGGDSTSSTSSSPVPATATLAEALGASGQTATMDAAVKGSGLTAEVSGDTTYTLLMPSDEAMAPYAEDLAELSRPENRADLQAYVKSHMVEGRVLADALAQAATRATAQSTGGTARTTIKNLLGEDIEITVSAGTITINGATISRSDIVVRNGVLHVLSGPLFRPNVFGIVRGLSATSTLEAAVRAAGLVDALRDKDGKLTLFAPTNAAFDGLLRELNVTAEQLLANKPLLTTVLTYHVLGTQVLAKQIADGATPQTLQGQNITLDVGADGFGQRTIAITDARGRVSNVTVANLRARNGVVHLIDKVILPTDQDIVQIAAANSAFSTLVAAVQAAGLVYTLKGPGPFTVFAPTNDAFAALLAELNVTAEQLLANKPLLTEVLTYHVLPARVLAADIRDGATPTTVQGQTFTLDTDGGKVTITDGRGRVSNVVATNVQATNGVIHVIDKVILPRASEPPPPPTPNIVQIAQSSADFSILVEAVVAAGLVDTLSGAGPFTVFAPTNTAFAALLGELKVTKEQLLANKPLLTAVLTYHVLPAKVLAADIRDGAHATTVQGQVFRLGLAGGPSITDAQGRKANITSTDIVASNGVVHVIDKVILPQTKNIVEIAVGAPQFSILVEAVLAAGLQDALSGPGPLTVFAPTNDAFVALLHELHLTKAQLLADKPLLTKVLTYHVLGAKVLSKDVTDGAKPATLQGQTFTLRRSGNAIRIVDANGRSANVTAADTQAVNGVIHTIDKVILPK